jgi:hypothetical protein
MLETRMLEKASEKQTEALAESDVKTEAMASEDAADGSSSFKAVRADSGRTSCLSLHPASITSLHSLCLSLQYDVLGFASVGVYVFV